MDVTTRSWLLSQLGVDTDLVDLETRLARLGTARRVALEVLYERKAKLIASPLVLGVSNVVNVSYAGNIAALERQIAVLEDPDGPAAPGEPGYGETAGSDHIRTFRLRERRRR
jgi:hypothetical protein